jgi:hypothetical protein
MLPEVAPRDILTHLLKETDAELLRGLVQDFESAVEASRDSRHKSERDRDYYDGYQWTDEELATLRTRKQPPITVNRIKPKVDFLLGLERKQRNDPKAFPRTPSDQGSADAATDGIRYVCDDNSFDAVRSDVFRNALIEGFGGADISVQPQQNGYKITIRWIPWDRLFFDPHSRREDFSDARYLGQVIWMDQADCAAKWPEAWSIFEQTVTSEPSGSETYDDRPQERWTDPKRKRIRIVEMWKKQGNEWRQYKFTKAGLLEEAKVSPYVDEEGFPETPLELVSAFVDRDGNRYGVVRNWIGIQDEINKRRSKALHLLSVRQVQMERGAVDDVEKTRRELAKPDGLIETTPGFAFNVLDSGDMAAAQFNLLQEAKQEIDAVGVNASLSGTDSRQMSGRAIIARQEGGMAELGPIFDQLRMWQLRLYRKIWNRIRQYWTEEKWIRVTDDERVPRHVGLNQKVTRLQAEIERAQASGGVPPELQQLASMDPQQIAQIAPQMLQVVEVRNNVAELDVDIILSEVPDTVAIQAEQFEALTKMAQSGVPIPPDALIEASSLRNKDQILKKMESGGVPPQVQQQIQQSQQQAAEVMKAAQGERQKAEEIQRQVEMAQQELQAQQQVLKYEERILRLEEQLARAHIESSVKSAQNPGVSG